MSEINSPEERIADAALDESEKSGFELAAIDGEPHPKMFGGTIFHSGNGPRWVINNEAYRQDYYRRRVEYFRSLHESQARRIAELERDRKTDRECLEHYQARFSLITDAWRKGDNDAILDAVRKHITAKDVADADRLLAVVPPTPPYPYTADGLSELVTKLENISCYGVDDAYGIVAEGARVLKRLITQPLPEPRDSQP